MKKFLLFAFFAIFVNHAFSQTRNLDIDATIAYVIEKQIPLTKVIGNTTMVWDITTNTYIPTYRFNNLYGTHSFDILCYRYNNFTKGKSILYDNKSIPYNNNKLIPFKWKLKTTNTVVGSCLIGGSVTIALLSNAILSQKAENTYNNYNSYADTQRIIYYSCAGLSLAGAIVILTGLHKEYTDGIALSDNWTIKDCGGGLSLSHKF